MNKKLTAVLLKIVAMAALWCCQAPAFAHVNVMHSMSGFQAGFLHPLLGLDHLLAMVAVGMWAAQHQRPASWLLPLVFPLMMVVGALCGVAGILIPGVEAGIAASVLILGLLIASAAKLALPFSVSLIAVFAMAHGYAHGVELPPGAKAIAFGSGFVLSTALLHLSGLALTIAANRTLHARVIRYTGTLIAMLGLFFVSAMA